MLTPTQFDFCFNKTTMKLNRGSLIIIIALSILYAGGCTNETKESSAEKSDLLTYQNPSGEKIPVKSPADWEQKRRQILEDMENGMGELPDRSGLPPLDVQFTDSLKTDRYTRYTISFTVAENEKLPAYLYIPLKKPTSEKFPAMLALHGTGDLGKQLVDGQSPKTNRAYAKELAERGYVVIAPDYPSMGDLKDYDFATDRYQSGTMKAIFNHIRCVDLLQSRKDVDPERIGVIGHSLGGHNAMFAGAFDQRLKVIVSSCGWTLMDYYDIGEAGTKQYGGRLGPWAQDRYMPLLRDKYKLDPEKIPFDFDEIIAALAPRLFFSNSPLRDSNFDVAGVREGIAEASEVYDFLGVKDNIQVAYPDAEHDFPAETRLQAYQFIDRHFNHTADHRDLE